MFFRNIFSTKINPGTLVYAVFSTTNYNSCIEPNPKHFYANQIDQNSHSASQKVRELEHSLKSELREITDPYFADELLKNISALVQALQGVQNRPPQSKSSLITSTIQLATQYFRQINDQECIEDLGNFAAISCCLRESLHFYWRWISEIKPQSNPRINELIHSQQIVKPKCWILLDVTKNDQPVLIEKQVETNFCQSLSAIISAIKFCEFESPKFLINHLVTRQLKIGSLVIMHSSWYENDQKQKPFWRTKLSPTKQNKSRKHYNLYTVYSSQ
jgi:hypothetical protein